MTQQLGFDALERNAILDRALEHATSEWRRAALTGIAELAGTGRIFQATDLVRLGVPDPEHSARWGAVFSYAAKVGLIERVGYAPSARSTVRGSVAATWRGAGVTPVDDGPPVKAISLKRPWSAYVVEGRKTIENRTWTTTHRGLLVIHASQSWDRDTSKELATRLDEVTGYIGVVELTGICHAMTGAAPIACPCYESGWAYTGHTHWQLADARPFDLRIPGKGRLGIWTPPLDVIQAARRTATSNRLESTA